MSRATDEGAGAELTGRPKRRRRRLATYLALSSFAVITAAILFYQQRHNSRLTEQPKPDGIVTQKGSRSQNILPDGTTVWLNGDSKLHYDNDFSGATREVTLEGEAFFDVVKEADRPFIVHTSGIDIKVLGTAFNVKSYPEDKNVETTLYRGSVEVFRHTESSKNAIKLAPNQKVSIAKQAANVPLEVSEGKRPVIKEISRRPIITPIDSTKIESERIETAWVYDQLKFDVVPFEDVAKKLERWFNVTITFSDEKVKKLNVYGSFEDETVEQTFNALKEAFKINYKIINHEVFVESSQ